MVDGFLKIGSHAIEGPFSADRVRTRAWVWRNSYMKIKHEAIASQYPKNSHYEIVYSCMYISDSWRKATAA
jgi:hypothetical protein